MGKIENLLLKVPDKKDLLSFLQQYMTEDRSIRFKEVLAYRTRHLTIAVEDVYQERNASAIVRSSDCFGIQDVYIIENYNTYQLSSGISKGADKWIDVHIYDKHPDNSERCISDLKDRGYRIVAATPHSKVQLLEDFDISGKSAFFLGGEKEGLSGRVMDLADSYIRIPMYGFTESYNISVAGALLLYSLTKRLHNSDIDWHLSTEEKLELQLNWTIKTIASSENLILKYLEKKGRLD
jgi:tRNA (guanosine-2'-O-)-methyltransferase